MNNTKSEVIQYISDTYGVSPEFLWENSLDCAAIRHTDSKKWFGVLMNDISKSKLGLDSTEPVDIIDLKCDPLMIGSVIDGIGFLPGYHMNKEHWITVLLDGTVPAEKIFPLIDLSFELTKKVKKNRKRN
ncbi:MAG: MmcQ/YjbR family DNA-binding protein [Ruminococcus sp.]|nr:MmcQ/YjbR family DNA-binding protein [Ruminococcus sp.]